MHIGTGGSGGDDVDSGDYSRTICTDFTGCFT